MLWALVSLELIWINLLPGKMRGLRLINPRRGVGPFNGGFRLGQLRRAVKLAVAQAVKLAFYVDQSCFDVGQRPMYDAPDDALRVDDKSKAVATRLRAAARSKSVQVGDFEIEVFYHGRFEVNADKTPGFVRPVVVLPHGFVGQRQNLGVALVEPFFFERQKGGKHGPSRGEIGRMGKKYAPTALLVVRKTLRPFGGLKLKDRRAVADLWQISVVGGGGHK
jgi:hypothetical protein